MDREELMALQARTGWTNRYIAALTGRCEQSVSNWRCGRQKIPPYVGLLLNHEEQEVSRASKVRRKPAHA